MEVKNRKRLLQVMIFSLIRHLYPKVKFSRMVITQRWRYSLSQSNLLHFQLNADRYKKQQPFLKMSTKIQLKFSKLTQIRSFSKSHNNSEDQTPTNNLSQTCNLNSTYHHQANNDQCQSLKVHQHYNLKANKHFKQHKKVLLTLSNQVPVNSKIWISAKTQSRNLSNGSSAKA